MKRLCDIESIKCVNCYYWHTSNQNTALFGQCRRQAPVALPIQPETEQDPEEALDDYLEGFLEDHYSQIVAIWPETRRDDFCGDFAEVGGKTSV